MANAEKTGDNFIVNDLDDLDDLPDVRGEDEPDNETLLASIGGKKRQTGSARTLKMPGGLHIPEGIRLPSRRKGAKDPAGEAAASASQGGENPGEKSAAESASRVDVLRFDDAAGEVYADEEAADSVTPSIDPAEESPQPVR